MSIDSQIADAGAIRVAAVDLLRLLQKVKALQDAQPPGSVQDPENPEVVYQLAPGERQKYADKANSLWTTIKQAAARN